MFTVNELNFIKECVLERIDRHDPGDKTDWNPGRHRFVEEHNNKCYHLIEVIDEILAKWFDHVIMLNDAARKGGEE